MIKIHYRMILYMKIVHLLYFYIYLIIKILLKVLYMIYNILLIYIESKTLSKSTSEILSKTSFIYPHDLCKWFSLSTFLLLSPSLGSHDIQHVTPSLSQFLLSSISLAASSCNWYLNTLFKF